jgi:hypothetical protein
MYNKALFEGKKMTAQSKTRMAPHRVSKPRTLGLVCDGAYLEVVKRAPFFPPDTRIVHAKLSVASFEDSPAAIARARQETTEALASFLPSENRPDCILVPFMAPFMHPRFSPDRAASERLHKIAEYIEFSGTPIFHPLDLLASPMNQEGLMPDRQREYARFHNAPDYIKKLVRFRLGALCLGVPSNNTDFDHGYPFASVVCAHIFLSARKITETLSRTDFTKMLEKTAAMKRFGQSHQEPVLNADRFFACLNKAHRQALIAA